MELLREYVQQVLIERGARDAAHCRYESLVVKTLRVAKAAGYIKRANCVDSNKPDADFVVNGENHYVEVKSDADARMGTASIGYSYPDKAFFPTGRDFAFSSMVADVLNETGDTSLIRGLHRLIRHLKQSAITPDKVVAGFPLSGFRAKDWQMAADFGLLAPINRTFNGDIRVIIDHYAAKDVHYIQIGGWGLFYLGNNPANLPVPQLSGKVRMRVAAMKSGDQPGRASSKAALRVYASIMPAAASPYTLDDLDSIREMMAYVDHHENLAPRPA